MESRVEDVAIYISTTKSDYRLGKAFVESIEQFADRPLIYILPDDDYPSDRMFGHPVWKPRDPRILALDRYYKKLRVFWGPAERFVYVDADQIVLRDLRPFLDHLRTRDTPFFMASWASRLYPGWLAGDSEARRRWAAGWVGPTDQLAQFEPAFDPTAAYPFASGNWAASRNVFDQTVLLDEFARALEFHARSGRPEPMSISREAVFNGDQGFLNYMVWKHGVAVDWIPDFFWWGGLPESEWTCKQTPSPYTGLFVHWGGCPRPGPVPIPWSTVPLAARWRQFYYTYCRKHGDWIGCAKDSADFLALLGYQSLSRLKRRLF